MILYSIATLKESVTDYRVSIGKLYDQLNNNIEVYQEIEVGVSAIKYMGEILELKNPYIEAKIYK